MSANGAAVLEPVSNVQEVFGVHSPRAKLRAKLQEKQTCELTSPLWVEHGKT
jgi:hypothetical protein